MSTLAAANLQKTLRRKDTAEIATTVPPFPVIESPELKAKLSSEQYAAVQSYRDVLIEAALKYDMNVEKLTLGFSEMKDAPDDILFAIDVYAEAQTAMNFWERIDTDRDVWLLTQSPAIKEFIYEHFTTSVRWK